MRDHHGAKGKREVHLTENNPVGKCWNGWSLVLGGVRDYSTRIVATAQKKIEAIAESPLRALRGFRDTFLCFVSLLGVSPVEWE